MTLLRLVCLLVLASPALVRGYEDGCPVWHCTNGWAMHDNHEAQTGSSGASITLSGASYTAGSSITVTLTGNFEGFVIRAQRAPGAIDTTEIVGGFSSYPSNVKGMSWLPRSGSNVNCLTHKDEDDFTSLTFTWSTPMAVGDVIFRATVLTDFEIFWTNVESAVLTGPTETPAESTDYQVNADFSNYNFGDGCGSTKGCLMWPRGCSGDGCDLIVAYQAINSQSDVMFEMSVVIDSGYLSLGFSDDKRMGDELTVTCSRDSSGTLNVEHGFDNSEYYNQVQMITDLKDIHVKSQNGRLYCSFTRATTLTYTEAGTTTSKTSDLSNNVYLFAATGDTFIDTSVVKKHIILPLVSTGKINVRDTKISYGTYTSLLIALHVFFGLLGYFIISSFGMLIARHYRFIMSEMMPPDGAALWFQLHRGLLIPMLVLGVIAIILGLLSTQGWNIEAIATAHGIFSILATVIMLINIILGFVKPGPRQRFNMVHRILGIISYLLIVISLLLGSNVELLHPDLKVAETIIIAVGFGIQIIIEIVLEVMRCRPSQKTEDYDMDKDTDSNSGKKDCATSTKIALLIIFCLATLAVGLAGIVLGFLY